MYYNLENFGNKLKELRRAQKLSQKELAESALVDAVTIRRIEKGLTLPKVETLDVLSGILKYDLNMLLLECRLDDYIVFHEIQNRIEFEMDNRNYQSLDEEIENLKQLLHDTTNPYYTNLIQQLISFVDAVIFLEDVTLQKNVDERALQKFIDAIRLTTPKFELENYREAMYSPFEVRILMNIGFCFQRMGENDKYFEIISFCMDCVSENDKIYPKICHNLAGAYRRRNDFQKALELTELGIAASQRKGYYNGLGILYYGKAHCEYALGMENFRKSYYFAETLFEAFGQKDALQIIRSKFKNILE
ncbi:MAG: helix-turn-helix transcriptional regulator [Peptostreptococcaceae bacterium]|nr:helix-turn-helix transcriptional regulator [Peptostreptococcaceae bacterium]